MESCAKFLQLFCFSGPPIAWKEKFLKDAKKHRKLCKVFAPFLLFGFFDSLAGKLFKSCKNVLESLQKFSHFFTSLNKVLKISIIFVFKTFPNLKLFKTYPNFQFKASIKKYFLQKLIRSQVHISYSSKILRCFRKFWSHYFFTPRFRCNLS